MSIKVSLISLGCPKNQVDAEHILGYLNEDKRFEVVEDQNKSDAIIVNTCAFIDDAKKEAIDILLDLADKKENNLKCLIVTGCLAQRYAQQIQKEIPQVDVVLGLTSIDQINESIINAINGQKVVSVNNQNAINKSSERFVDKNYKYAYLKIADGCDNYCTYCAIPKIRGRFRSRSVEDIVSEARWLTEQGMNELILVAQDTSYYGKDLYGKIKLPDLLRELDKLDLKWIRFLYTYPERIDERLLEVMQESEKIVNYIDMPIQHINDYILKRMNRNITSKEIYNIIDLIRKKLEDVTLRTSIITGFPGETQSEFLQLLQFVKDIEFDRLGCFAYSREEETPAAGFDRQVPQEIKEQREQIIMFEQQRLIEKKSDKNIGKKVRTMVDRYEDGYFIGRTKKDAPDIDLNVYFKSSQRVRTGEMVDVLVEKTEFGDMYGKKIEKETIH